MLRSKYVYNVFIYLIILMQLSGVHLSSDIGTLRYYEKLFFSYDNTRYGAPIDDGEEPHHEYRKATINHESDGAVIVRLKAFASTIAVTLWKDVSESNTIVEIHDGGKITRTSTEEMGLVSYVGTARAEPGSDGVSRRGTASGYILEGIFEGRFQLAEDTYYVESARSYCENYCKHNAIIYKSSDVIAASLLEEECLTMPLKCANQSDAVNSGIFQKPYSMARFDSGLSHYRKDPNRPRSCNIEVIADHTYYAYLKNEKLVISRFRQYLRHVNDIFIRTDFNQDGKPDNIGMKTAKVTVFKNADEPGNPLKSNSLNSTNLLNDLAVYKNSFCLVFGVVHREFTHGDVGSSVLGTRESGGICQKVLAPLIIGTQHLPKGYSNIGLMTTLKKGHVFTSLIIMLTIAHELGHSFGSVHDDPSNPKCSPPGNKYLMHPYHVDGSKDHNYYFSPCSVGYMLPHIYNKGNCLIEASVAAGRKCGNGRRDEGEECDCGLKETCEKMDHCCTPPGGEKGDKECHVKKSAGYQCSPSQGSCCDPDSCRFSPPETSCIERNDTCRNGSHCDGKSPICPRGKRPKPDGTPCFLTFKTCVNGECKSDVCQDNNLRDCSCPTPGDDRCKVCCLSGGECQPASKLNLFVENRTALQLSGTSCRDTPGFLCDEEGICRPLKEIRPIDTPAEYISTVHEIQDWIISNWLYFLLTFLTLCLIFGAIRGRKCLKRYVEKAKMLMEQIELAKKKVDARYPEFEGGIYNREVYQALCRLVLLFPTAPLEELYLVANEQKTERASVEHLLQKGYNIKNL